MRTLSTGRSSSPFVSFAFASLLLAGIVGCDDKKPATTAPTAAPVVSAAPAMTSAKPVASTPPAASAKPFAEKLKCEALLPEPQRQTLGLLNFKLSQQATCPDCGPTCSLVRPDRPFEGVAVSYTCNATYDKAAADKELDELKKNTLKKPAAITQGRGGVMGEKDNGAFYSAVVYDDDSDCKIAIDWMKGDRKVVEPMVKVTLANVKQADVVAAKSK